MKLRMILFRAFAFFAILAATLQPARSEGIAAYDAWTKGADAQRGLLTVWHKDGKVYLELAAAQLDHEFIATIVPASGIGGQGVVWGNTDHLPTELLRFERAGGNVALIWPSPYFVAPNAPAAARAIDASFARSIVGLAPIVASDAKSGALVIDAAPFLDDQLNLKAVLKANIKDRPKADPYTLDKDRSYFGATKAFPKNVVLEARQSWHGEDRRIADVTADPRNLQLKVVYNIAEPPDRSDYTPRYADDRVGIYDAIYQSYDKDRVLSRKLRYLVRWNFQPSDPTKPISPAKHPMVFYLSDTIPEAYRPAIRAGVLKWNLAFEKIGISDALQVRDQPNDPTWDPDDIRYNVLRWVTEYRASFGADSQTLFDPRTGEEFRTGILISADVPLFAQREWTHVVDPARFGRTTDPMPQQYLDDQWLSVIMHETGHNLGMQHNFIGSRAYTAKELQDKSFTSKYGIASTVMEYAPLNIWPASTPQGDYAQTTLGPYDYYAMKWAYARVPGAKTPEDEIPTLSKWASVWSDPKYRYASDEDVSWRDGHASDPRVEQGILTNDPIGWCAGQLALDRTLLARLNDRFPAAGAAFEDETDAFRTIMGRYANCVQMPTHYIGGQYVSRAHRGDPGARAPIVPVAFADQKRAFDLVDRYLFAANAFSMSPSLVANLGYSEWAGYGYVGFEGYGNLPQFSYDPPERHDVSIATEIGTMQGAAIAQMFHPLVLARIADGASETADRRPMALGDLFDWMHRSVFTELRGTTGTPAIGTLRRNLQKQYLETLIALYTTPAAGAPSDARSLARAELVTLGRESARAGRSASRDPETLAHLAFLQARIRTALQTDRTGGGA